MTKPVKATLFLIGLFVGGMMASFVWFVATWDKSKEEPVTFELYPVQSAAPEAA